ncbi:accessory Sec system protein Asp3 [Gemella sp. GH3]|uniref:accessory Sec system protein Asp3 n=1 Tax=unclassified Gemella TaxID=2624949 RepID=UPI0015D07E42|nr:MULTISPECIES: accessory Sec system protein Asp3 [unclassified Gemella]MBF0714049.1 accessory Sec system protein Asp3 [Gemella sp. GH3.1]NYS51001.1 accessory Sec system protein Asp3 [Gemella sp. GH3]
MINKEYFSNIIYWDNFSINSYLFGSIIKFKSKDFVHFKNLRMPSGKDMNEWLSKTNHQSHRYPPQLPMLKKGHLYKIYVNAETVPENSIYLRIIFYDRYEKIISETVIRSNEDIFVYPNDAYSYKIQVMNAGCSELKFHYIELTEQIESFDKNSFIVSDILNKDINSADLNVIFMEPNQNKFVEVNKELFKNYSNIVMVTSKIYNAHIYCYKFLFDEIASIFENNNFKNINFYGNGTFSDIAAVQYKLLTENSKAYIMNYCQDYEKYKKILDNSYIAGKLYYKDYSNSQISEDRSIYVYNYELEDENFIFDKFYDNNYRILELLDIGKER